MRFHEKQKEVIKCIKYENPKILICSGAKRSGKTYVLTFAYMAHIAKFQNKGYSFIMGGATQSSIRRNILNDMENILGKEIKLAKDNHFDLFGNKVYCFDGANADAYKKVRGFTSYGAFLNEATTLHNTFVKECISRCSGEGARIYMDTNPENPMHTVKTDYVDKSGQRLENGQLNIKAFQFTLFDNTFLNEEYTNSIIASTPSGMFTDRDIYGKWVAAEGVVYQDFNKDIHYIKEEDIDKSKIIKYYCGVDWEYEHYGSIVLLAKDTDNNIYLLKEYSDKHKEIDYWVNIAKKIKEEYGNIYFYADSARPEHVARFQREGIRCVNANKAVLAGIEEVAKLFKLNKFKIVEANVNRFKEEIYNYVWNEKKGEPVKEQDDVLDSIRYAIYSEMQIGKTIDRRKLGI